MYSRKHGKSGSKKPIKKVVPSWSRYSAKEVEMLVTKLSKDGKNPSQIGLILRDVYGVPSVKVYTTKRITRLLEEKKLAPQIPEDLMSLMKRAVQITKHLEKNHLDQPAVRGLKITESKINKIAAHHKENGKLPLEWKYDAKRLRMIIE